MNSLSGFTRLSRCYSVTSKPIEVILKFGPLPKTSLSSTQMLQELKTHINDLKLAQAQIQDQIDKAQKVMHQIEGDYR